MAASDGLLKLPLVGGLQLCHTLHFETNFAGVHLFTGAACSGS